MKQISQDMASGKICAFCGRSFEKEHGHPVYCHKCWENPQLRDKGVLKSKHK